MRKKKLLLSFILVFAFLAFNETFTYAQPGDTLWVSSVDPVLPKTTVTVEVRLKTTHNVDALVIPLQFKNDDNLDIRCDSIHWSDWFYKYEPVAYSGKDPAGVYINNESAFDSLYKLPPKSMRIWAVWFLDPPYLKPGDTTLVTLYFTAGKNWQKNMPVEIHTYVTTQPTNELVLAYLGEGYYPEFMSGFLGPGRIPERGKLNVDR